MPRRTKKTSHKIPLLLALSLLGIWYGSYWLTVRQADAFITAFLMKPATTQAISFQEYKADHSFFALPWRVAYRFENLSWKEKGEIRIKASHLSLLAVPWNPRGFSVAWDKKSSVALPALGIGKNLHLAGGGDGVAVWDNQGGIELLDLKFHEPEISIDDQPFISARELELRREQTSGGSEDVAETKASITFSDILLDPKDKWPFGSKIRKAALTFRVKGPETDFTNPSARAIWRDKGGVIELDNIALDWPPFGVVGDGTFALDSRGEVQAALTAKVRNMEDSLAHLEKESFVSKEHGKLLRATFSGAQGQGPETSVPVSIQNRTLYVGPLLLFKFGD